VRRAGLCVTILLILVAALLSACGEATGPTPSSPTAAPTDTLVAFVPTESPAPTASATPTLTPTATSTRTQAPTATPSPSATATRTRAPTATRTVAPTPTATPTPVGLTFLEASPPLVQTCPAGSTVLFGLRTDPIGPGIRYWVEGLPSEITAFFLGNPAPYINTLALETSGALAPGAYEVHPAAAIGDQRPVFAQIGLEVTACTEFHTGVFTQELQSNLVQLYTAGKPSREEGQLVPLQVCASEQARRLKVTLEGAISQAGTPMTTPPRFYIFRSFVWPAPDCIVTHNYGVNASRAADAIGWEMELDITPGLWLLVFEQARFGSSEDPHDIPAIVTYRLELLY
jgi:hypothetical protein